MDDKDVHVASRLSPARPRMARPARRFTGMLFLAILALYLLNLLPIAPFSFLQSRRYAATRALGLQKVVDIATKLPATVASENDKMGITGAGMTSVYDRVPLEAHIMSKCSDAQYCFEHLVVPAMERISDLVDFNVSFIGSLDREDNSTVVCKHGPAECLGNQLMLCAQKLYPGQPKLSVGFSNCLLADYHDIPGRTLVQNCALEHAVDFDQLNACISADGQGEEMLRSNVLWSQEEGVINSCTVRVGGQIWCVRDSLQWKQCPGGSEVEDLVEEIKKRSGGQERMR